jgi:hypothetical protein
VRREFPEKGSRNECQHESKEAHAEERPSDDAVRHTRILPRVQATCVPSGLIGPPRVKEPVGDRLVMHGANAAGGRCSAMV